LGQRLGTDLVHLAAAIVVVVAGRCDGAAGGDDQHLRQRRWWRRSGRGDGKRGDERERDDGTGRGKGGGAMGQVVDSWRKESDRGREIPAGKQSTLQFRRAAAASSNDTWAWTRDGDSNDG